jgi:ubiquinone/menaquinone biosynthesis C-methylase UbiE
MSHEAFGKRYSENPAENYERYFVPAIAAPLAEDLLQTAALRPGERVIDVACGTGVVTRGAAARVGGDGSVAGVDVNPAMLHVARAVTPPGTSIRWYEASADAMPLPDDGFDVVLCQMGLQFFPDKVAALREMRRVLAPGGRLVLNLPGPTPPPLAIFADGLARHIDAKAALFVHLVFSHHDPGELREEVTSAGFQGVDARRETRKFRVPPPREFLWDYVHSTPLANAVLQADDARRESLERDVTAAWQAHVEDGLLAIAVGITTVTATK